MQAAGIDTALAVYWTREEGFSNEGLKNLSLARNQLETEGKNPPKIGLFLDTNSLNNLPKKKRNLEESEGKSNFYSYIKDFYQILEKENWAAIEGKPIIWLYGNYFGFKYDQSTFDYIYLNFENDFGVKPYIVRELSWNKGGIKTDDIYGWGTSYIGYGDAGGNIASIGPGYDERHIPKRNGNFKDRDGGNWYKSNFQMAMESKKPMLVIETWNEFHEASDIANSVEFKKSYINLTKEFSKRWKN